MKSENITIQEPECLEDLDLLKTGDIVVIERGDEWELRVYNETGIHKMNGELEFMKHFGEGYHRAVNSLYLPRANLKIQHGIIKLLDQKHQGYVNWWEHSDYSSPLDYRYKKQIIEKAGLEKWEKE